MSGIRFSQELDSLSSIPNKFVFCFKASIAHREDETKHLIFYAWWQVAAVDEPKLHLWETGIIRITRHPQAVGQLIWCIAHTAWVGSSFMVAASLGLMAHHAFGCWHGDYRLKRKYGESFEALKERTSIIPFAAVLDGRQVLPQEYWREFLRAPYLFLVPFCIGCYLSHPLMQRASLWLGW